MADNLLTRFKLSDQTSVGMPSTSILSSIASDKTALALNDPLFSWYAQALPMVSDPNTKKIYDTVIGVVNRNRYTQQKTKDLSADIVKRIEALNAHETDTGDKPLADKIQSMLGMSPLATSVKSKTDTSTPTGKKEQEGGGNRLTEYLEKWNDKSTKNNKEKLQIQFQNDPIASPDNEKLTTTDRIIFIAMTFVLRGITLFLVEWAVNTYMVKSFEDAFKLYLVCYLAIFAVWAIMVNASDGLFFRMLFYYIDNETFGYGRIMVHFLVQMVLLPVPYIVKTKGFQYTEEEYTYEQRRKTMSILSNFTFFIWAITSVIALRY